jgi:trehalose synthase
MLERVDVGLRHLSAYRSVAPETLLDDLEQAAARLRGARVLHVNATPYGGGVSELLRSIVPLMNDLGIIAHWKIIRGDERFFEVTKKIHNGLQGGSQGQPPLRRYVSTALQAPPLRSSRVVSWLTTHNRQRP